MKRLVDINYLNDLEAFYAEASRLATTDRKQDADRCYTRAWRLSIKIDRHIMKGINTL